MSEIRAGKRWLRAALLGLLLPFVLITGVTAQSLSSPGYQIDESYIGPGGTIDSSSASYGTQGSVGDTGVGETGSANYQAVAGSTTTAEPTLSMVVNTSSASLGAFSTSVASRATASFSVLNYTSYGYAVYTVGNPPSNGSHTLTGMGTTTASQVGVEQFGINLKANTSPATFGADPAQVPSSAFSFGSAATGYNTANNFRYVSGEKIAEATKSSGQTDYTVSYIVNIASSTSQGAYTGTQGFVVVATY